MNTDKSPLVSVIMPVYNGALYIREAIESVLNQTLKDVEIIVSDDGSTDSTHALIEPWIKDGTIRYIHQSNRGVSAARNAAIRMAKGTFLKFLDSDDVLFPRQLELQVGQLIDKPDNFLSVSDCEYEFESKAKKHMKIILGHMSQLARFIHGSLGPPHVFLVRRSMIERIDGFDEGMSSCEDSDLWLRVIIQGGVVEKLDYLGCRYRILSGSLDADMDKGLLNFCKVFEKLNRAVLPKLDQWPKDVLEQLLLKNINLFHRCFKKKIEPSDYLATSLKVSQIIYVKKALGIKKFIAMTIGIQNVAYLLFIKAYFTTGIIIRT